MSGGNGPKYVTLPDDDRAHLLADDKTVCGLPVPAFGDYDWSYTPSGDPCTDCGLEEAPKKPSKAKK